VYFVPVMLASTLMWCESRRWFQPGGVRLSWRGIVLQTARWPVVLWALINVVLRIKRSYMITPKGKAAGGGPRALSIYAPYIVLAALPLVAIWLFDAGAGSDLLRGYYWLVLGNALMGGMVLATTLGMDIKQIAAEDSALRTAVRSRAVVVLALACLVALFGLSVAHFGHQAVHAMTAA
jgi:hypothetical protein